MRIASSRLVPDNYNALTFYRRRSVAFPISASSHCQYTTPVKQNAAATRKDGPKSGSASSTHNIALKIDGKPISRSISAESIKVEDYSPPKTSEPPLLEHGLERVLFNPGVATVQCPRTGVFNFVPSVKEIPSISRFKPELLPPYLLPFDDPKLRKAFSKHKEKVRYLGATSTITAALQHLHFLLSRWRPVNLSVLSQSFKLNATNPTSSHRAPVSLQLKTAGSNQWVVNSDFRFGDMNKELMRVGHMLELKLTVPPEEFEKFLTAEKKVGEHENSKHEDVSEADEFKQEAVNDAEHTYNYAKIGSFLVRSQLDARHPRLSTSGGSGYFDIKTRAALAVRMDPLERHPEARNYSITGNRGTWSSYEREMYDLMRTMMLKYSLQARIGQMDGIFIAHHNLSNILGFQFLSLPDMDEMVHGQRDDDAIDSYSGLAGQEFRMSFMILEHILDVVAEKLPGDDIWLHFDSVGSKETGGSLRVFAERVTPTLIKEIAEYNAEQKALKAPTSEEVSQTSKPEEPERVSSLMQQATSLQEQTLSLNSVLGQLKIDLQKAKTPPTVARLIPMVKKYIVLAERYKRLQADELAMGEDDIAVKASLDRTKAFLAAIEEFAQSLPFELQVEAFSKGKQAVKPEDHGNIPFHWKHEPKDLLALTIDLENLVDGRFTQRPKNLSSEQKWTANYTISTLAKTSASHTYRTMLQRKMVTKNDDYAANLYESKYYSKILDQAAKGLDWETKLQQRGRDNLARHHALTASMGVALDKSIDYIDEPAPLLPAYAGLEDLKQQEASQAG